MREAVVRDEAAETHFLAWEVLAVLFVVLPDVDELLALEVGEHDLAPIGELFEGQPATPRWRKVLGNVRPRRDSHSRPCRPVLQRWRPWTSWTPWKVPLCPSRNFPPCLDFAFVEAWRVDLALVSCGCSGLGWGM